MLFNYHYQYNYGGDGGGNCPKSVVFISLSDALYFKRGPQTTSLDVTRCLLDAESQALPPTH